MTLVIAVANADHVIQVSDRRLTHNTQLVDDASNKAGHAVCEDASFLYSFTGIARVANHSTNRWLPGALYDAAQKGHRYHQIVDSFAEEATRYFRSSSDIRSLAASYRRLTVLFSGYTSEGHIVTSLISNYQDFTNFIDSPAAKPEFTTYTEKSLVPAAQNPTMIQVIGQFGAFTQNDESQLRSMLEQRSPAEGVRRKAIAVIQDIADRPVCRGTVGKRIGTARLSRADLTAPVVGYSSDCVENGIPLLDQIDLRSGRPRLLVADIRMDMDSPVVFPNVHRNAPCPCGSGKKYRYCHRN